MHCTVSIIERHAFHPLGLSIFSNRVFFQNHAGPPGTGKTSLAQVAATVFGMKLYIISMTSFFGTVRDLNSLLNSMQKPAMLLLEDLDTARLQNRQMLRLSTENTGEHKPEEGEKAPVGAVNGGPNPLGSGVLLDLLLQALDGVGAAQDRIVVITTNKLEDLDPALIRPGRIDIKVECGLATCEMAEKMFLRFFGPMEATSSGETGGKDDDGKKEQETAENELDPEEANALAKDFGKVLGSKVFSGAELEHYCVTIFGDPRAGVKNAEKWKKGTLAEKKKLETKRDLAAQQG